MSWLRGLWIRFRAYLGADEMDREMQCPHQLVGLCDDCYIEDFESQAW